MLIAMQFWCKSPWRAFTEQPCLISCHQISETSKKQVDYDTAHCLVLSFALPRHRPAVCFPPMERGCSSPAACRTDQQNRLLTDALFSQHFTLGASVELCFPCSGACNAESWDYSTYFATGFRNPTFFILTRLSLLMVHLLLFSPGKSINTLIMFNPSPIHG